MVARSGMFVAPLAGSPPVGMSPTDGRIAFSALLGTIPQPASGGAITQSASVMTITVAAGVFQLPDVSNAAGTSTFLSAIDQTTVTPAAGPATGSRVDLICTKQNNVENSDADSRANHFLVAGTAGAPGVAPAVPTGAYLYATVNVPATVTNAAACTVVIARPSTFGTLNITSPTFALLSTFAGVTNQRAYCPADGITYRYNGSAWKAWESDWIAYTPTTVGFTATNTSVYRFAAGMVRVRAKLVLTGVMASNPELTLPVTAAAPQHAYAIYSTSASAGQNGGASAVSVMTFAVANASTTNVRIYVGSGYTAVSATAPWTWAANDIIQGEFTFRPA